MPSLALVLGLALAAGVPGIAHAGPAEAFVPAALPANLSAPAELPERHVPSPFPEDGDVTYKGGGAGPFAVTAGILVAGSAVSGIVAAASHGKAKNAEDPSDAEKARKTRNVAGYTSLGMLGGAGICLVLNQAI